MPERKIGNGPAVLVHRDLGGSDDISVGGVEREEAVTDSRCLFDLGRENEPVGRAVDDRGAGDADPLPDVVGVADRGDALRDLLIRHGRANVDLPKRRLGRAVGIKRVDVILHGGDEDYIARARAIDLDPGGHQRLRIDLAVHADGKELAKPPAAHDRWPKLVFLKIGSRAVDIVVLGREVGGHGYGRKQRRRQRLSHRRQLTTRRADGPMVSTLVSHGLWCRPGRAWFVPRSCFVFWL
jgi:hypothetical protein